MMNLFADRICVRMLIKYEGLDRSNEEVANMGLPEMRRSYQNSSSLNQNIFASLTGSTNL